MTLQMLWAFIFIYILSLRNSDRVVALVFIDVPTNSKQDALFHRLVYDYSCAD